MKLVISAITATIFIGIFIAAFAFIYVSDNGPVNGCYPASASTGTIKCYSGGSLVYSADTYRNGGMLCKVDGAELDIDSSSTSVCIEESWQDDMWNPPAPLTEREVD